MSLVFDQLYTFTNQSALDDEAFYYPDGQYFIPVLTVIPDTSVPALRFQTALDTRSELVMRSELTGVRFTYGQTWWYGCELYVSKPDSSYWPVGTSFSLSQFHGAECGGPLNAIYIDVLTATTFRLGLYVESGDGSDQNACVRFTGDLRWTTQTFTFNTRIKTVRRFLPSTDGAAALARCWINGELLNFDGVPNAFTANPDPDLYSKVGMYPGQEPNTTPIIYEFFIGQLRVGDNTSSYEEVEPDISGGGGGGFTGTREIWDRFRETSGDVLIQNHFADAPVSKIWSQIHATETATVEDDTDSVKISGAGGGAKTNAGGPDQTFEISFTANDRVRLEFRRDAAANGAQTCYALTFRSDLDEILLGKFVAGTGDLLVPAVSFPMTAGQKYHVKVVVQTLPTGVVQILVVVDSNIVSALSYDDAAAPILTGNRVAFLTSTVVNGLTRYSEAEIDIIQPAAPFTITRAPRFIRPFMRP